MSDVFGEKNPLEERLANLEQIFALHDHNPNTRTARATRMKFQDLTNYRRVALDDGATITVNWKVGNTQSVTLGGNRTIAFTGQTDGQGLVLILKQDTTASRTVTWPSTVAWEGGTAPTLSTGSSDIDVFTFLRSEVENKEFGQTYGKNF